VQRINWPVGRGRKVRPFGGLKIKALGTKRGLLSGPLAQRNGIVAETRRPGPGRPRPLALVLLSRPASLRLMDADRDQKQPEGCDRERQDERLAEPGRPKQHSAQHTYQRLDSGSNRSRGSLSHAA
jgi:hypothetical protein